MISDIVLFSSVSVQLVAILALAVSVWSFDQRVGASLDRLEIAIAAVKEATGRLASTLDERARHNL